MSLLDDARKLLADTPMETDRGGRGTCHYCPGGNYEGGYLDRTPTLLEPIHKSDCPWLSMPKIVAALGAAERFIHCRGSNDDQEWESLSEALDA
jgi:hypothetical protein